MGAKEKEENGSSQQYNQKGHKDCGGMDTGDIQHLRTLGKAPPEAGVCSLSMLASTDVKFSSKLQEHVG